MSEIGGSVWSTVCRAVRVLATLTIALVATSSHAQASWHSASVRVVDVETGEPIEGAAVYALRCRALDRPETCYPLAGHRGGDEYFWGAGMTNADGRADFTATQTGVHALRIEHPDYTPVQMPPYLEVPANQPLPPGAERHFPTPHYEVALFPKGWALREATEEDVLDNWRY